MTAADLAHARGRRARGEFMEDVLLSQSADLIAQLEVRISYDNTQKR